MGCRDALWAEQRGGYHSDSIRSPVGVLTRADDHRVEELRPDSVAKPEELTHVLVRGDLFELYLDGKRAAVSSLNDGIHLVVAASGP